MTSSLPRTRSTTELQQRASLGSSRVAAHTRQTHNPDEPRAYRPWHAPVAGARPVYGFASPCQTRRVGRSQAHGWLKGAAVPGHPGACCSRRGDISFSFAVFYKRTICFSQNKKTGREPRAAAYRALTVPPRIPTIPHFSTRPSGGQEESRGAGRAMSKPPSATCRGRRHRRARGGQL